MRGKHRIEKPRDKGQREEPVAREHLESESHRRFHTIDESLCLVFLKPARHD